ncbi:MAG TPA: valine--tRNA ligase [Candidatus Woesebacteria bacterium]|nr:valine--tRNA ligase [Candidatus Woesebacteria bacterium]
MQKNYDHTQYEDKLYKTWEESGAFTPPSGEELLKSGKKPFTIIMPPPNANDPLHIGHAMFVTIEDIFIRYHRMKGEAALWLPGTDHAGIETQFVFEKKLAKEGKSRFDFDRDTLYKMIWDYVKENGEVAINQMKKLGATADWSRYKFTLDPEIVAEVTKTFKKLHDDGLIYRAEKLVNYCTKCGTAYSELEVEYQEKNDPLYYIKYGPFTLATVRPETKFGDTAVAVHPDDSRYKEWIGKEVEVEGLNGKFKLKVIADELVDPEFGTGVVKVTPAHDPNDFDMGQRHGLKMVQVIGLNGKLTEVAGKYAGMSVLDGRKKVVEDLQEKGLIEKIDEKYVHRIGTCYRCGRTIEPLPIKQFFIKVKPLADKALAALDSKETKILGAGRDKILRHWLMNLRDWNISRQIVWGIRMPVWYMDESKTEYEVSETSPGEGYIQETDTFDTWFSSGQWPVVTLKTNKPGDFEAYYPTDIMETAYDILPFWVMRMMLLSIYLTGKSPFKYVYLHGLVRDEKGQKMSKSKGNAINPLDLCTKYGTDSVRMALVMSTTAGQDSNTGENKVRGMRNFGNKIWNAGRYIAEKTNEDVVLKGEKDEEFMNKLSAVTKEVTKLLDQMKVGLASETVYNEFWHWFCDEGIEMNKQKQVSDEVLKNGYQTILKLLHPFVPFVTEAVWQEMFTNEELLMIADWPK